MKPTRFAAAMGLAAVAAACASQPPLPQPRTVLVYSGERLQTTAERVHEIDQWLQPKMEAIETDPSFLIRVEEVERPVYPWDGLELKGDTATVELQRAAMDARTPLLVYARFHMLVEEGTAHEWLPEVDEDEELTEFELEEHILEWVADVWLLGRSVYDTHAYGPLDELMYAKERGRLRDFIFATRPDRFAEERARHEADNPEWEEELRAFFLRTFEREGPGYLSASNGDEPPG